MARGVCSLIIALLFCVLWRIVLAARRYYAQLDTTSATAIRQRLLKPLCWLPASSGQNTPLSFDITAFVAVVSTCARSLFE